MKFPQVKQTSFILILGFILTAGLIFFGVDPQRGSISMLKQEVTQLAATREGARLEATNTEQLRRVYTNFDERYQSLTGIFVQRENALSFIRSLESAAEASGLSMHFSIPEIDEQAATNFQEVAITFDATGTFSNLLQFLSLLERQSPYFTIEALSFTRIGEGEGTSLVKLSFTALTYWQ